MHFLHVDERLGSSAVKPNKGTFGSVDEALFCHPDRGPERAHSPPVARCHCACRTEAT